jgi:hypothetical protein
MHARLRDDVSLRLATENLALEDDLSGSASKYLER